LLMITYIQSVYTLDLNLFYLLITG
jgi:hypothetical protein